MDMFVETKWKCHKSLISALKRASVTFLSCKMSTLILHINYRHWRPTKSQDNTMYMRKYHIIIAQSCYIIISFSGSFISQIPGIKNHFVEKGGFSTSFGKSPIADLSKKLTRSHLIA